MEIQRLDLNQPWVSDEHDFVAMRAELKELSPPPKKWKGWDGTALVSANSLVSAVVNGRAQELADEKRARGTQTVKIYVPSNETWTDTGLPLHAGQRIDITATGTIQWGGKPQDTCGPAGASSTAFLATKTDAPKGALLARVGETTDASEFEVIGDSGSLSAWKSGHLYLGVNDDNNSDNAGWYIATVQIH